MNVKKHIPNTITLGNLICGCLAVISIFDDQLVIAAYLVGIALVLDFFDGFTARLLKVTSPIGKDLDSLADMVTFGVVPGMMMFKMINLAFWKLGTKGAALNPGWVIDAPDYWCYFGLIIPVFSCIRLAKFNNDTRQTESFIGLPTPANAIVICSLALIYQIDGQFLFRNLTSNGAVFFNPYLLCGVSVVMSFLLIAELPLFALKFKNFSWSDNKVKYLFLLVSVALLIALKFVAIPLIILLYILISIVNNIFSKKRV